MRNCPSSNTSSLRGTDWAPSIHPEGMCRCSCTPLAHKDRQSGRRIPPGKVFPQSSQVPAASQRPPDSSCRPCKAWAQSIQQDRMSRKDTRIWCMSSGSNIQEGNPLHCQTQPDSTGPGCKAWAHRSPRIAGGVTTVRKERLPRRHAKGDMSALLDRATRRSVSAGPSALSVLRSCPSVPRPSTAPTVE